MHGFKFCYFKFMFALAISESCLWQGSSPSGLARNEIASFFNSSNVFELVMYRQTFSFKELRIMDGGIHACVRPHPQQTNTEY